MADFLVRQFYGWWATLVYGDLFWAAIYGVVAGGVAVVGYAWFTVQRKNKRVVRMRATPCRYLRLPFGR